MAGTLFFRNLGAAITFAVALVSASSLAAAADSDEQIKQIARELAKGATQHRIHRIAVEPFTDLGGSITPAGRFLAGELSVELLSHGIQVIDQNQLVAHLQKRKLAQFSTLARADLEAIGKELGLDGVIAGSVVESAAHVRLTTRLIAIRTGILVAAAKATMPRTGLLAELLQPPAEPPQPAMKPEEPPAQSDETQQPEGMVLIPAGPFIYGEGEQQRTITLPAFWFDVYEVTNARYAEVRVIDVEPLKDQYPVTNVSWYQARQFCLAKGKRLPTEQEWEKAARGTDGRLYPWGNTYEPNFVNAENRVGAATSIGRFEEGRSPYGLYDMAGNVMEWTGSGDDQAKVFRGGSWAASPQDVRVTSRSSTAPGFPLTDLGFRCAKDGPK
jgi:formylglycine-generating enzyme required for sulfatase activity